MRFDTNNKQNAKILFFSLSLKNYFYTYTAFILKIQIIHIFLIISYESTQLYRGLHFITF